jgi:hypothetical protein
VIGVGSWVRVGWWRARRSGAGAEERGGQGTQFFFSLLGAQWGGGARADLALVVALIALGKRTLADLLTHSPGRLKVFMFK